MLGGVAVFVHRQADTPRSGRAQAAVREESKDEPWVKPLVESYQNEAVKAEFDRVYNGTGISEY